MIDLAYFAAAASCKVSSGSFLGFPKWYEYLPGTPDANGLCIPQVTALNDVWLIVAAVIEILLRIAALAAIAYVIYGGVQYILSQGEPEKTAKAKNSIINAVIGLTIAVASASLIAFLARTVK